MLTSILISSALALFSGVAADYTYNDPNAAFSGYDLVWQDDFEGNTLNPAYWTVR
jgi:hypothetical protein